MAENEACEDCVTKDLEIQELKERVKELEEAIETARDFVSNAELQAAKAGSIFEIAL